jgi:hypothetical protein
MPLRFRPVILLSLSLLLASLASAEPFAVIPAAVADRLPSVAGTADGVAIIAAARSAIDRPPHAMPVMHTEGTLPHKGIHDASAIAEGDFPVMLNYALAARMTRDPLFIQAEEAYLRAWVSVYHPSFDPIDETNLEGMILADDLVGTRMPADLQAKMQTLLREVAEGYLAKIAHQSKEDTANWQSHRIKLITLCSFALGEPKLIEAARRCFQRQVHVNIQPDGAVVDFTKRDALHYVVYDLEPLSMAALAAREHGEDWFHPQPGEASSVAQGIDWLVPFALGKVTHEEFVHSTVGFDAARAKAGLKEYSGLWHPASSVALYQVATLFDPKYAAVVNHLAEAGARPRPWVSALQQAGL